MNSRCLFGAKFNLHASPYLMFRGVIVHVYKFINLKLSGILNTSRNSTEVLEKWKSRMKIEIIRAIEETCKNVMDYMGYEPYKP